MLIDRRLWRTGRTLGRTVYAQRGLRPATGDELLGLMETAELAAYVVELHNRDVARARAGHPEHAAGTHAGARERRGF